MLINCPRCGFSQPKDQYCAQCGVDMESFKPKAVPLFQRLIQSTKTHIILLLIAALFAGQYIIRSEEPQRWVQKITRSQGASQTKAKFNQADAKGSTNSSSEASARQNNDDDESEQLGSLRNKELTVAAAVEQPIQTGTATSDAAREAVAMNPTFRITYAEVPTDVIMKWINESSNAGLYQNLQEYSAGILTDFRKKMDSSVNVLKVAEKKMLPGQSETNFSGTIGNESGQMIGLATVVDFKSHENGVVHGTAVVSRNQRPVRDSFPAEFDLPKNAAFFMLGTIRSVSFQNERSQLTMPPFQIFKSPEFMTRKSEFVIIIEPEYK